MSFSPTWYELSTEAVNSERERPGARGEEEGGGQSVSHAGCLIQTAGEAHAELLCSPKQTACLTWSEWTCHLLVCNV